MKGGKDRAKSILPGCPLKNVRSFSEPLLTFTLITVRDFWMIPQLFLPQNWDMLEAFDFPDLAKVGGAVLVLLESWLVGPCPNWCRMYSCHHGEVCNDHGCH